MGWDGVSHIAGRYKYKFTGSEYLSVVDANTLDVTQNFSLSFLIKPDPAQRLNYALLSKGHPTNPATGSISVESINGFMRIYLHSSNGVNSLAYNTNTAILNTNEIIHIEIVWNFTSKVLSVYLNAVNIPITIITGGNFYSSASSMGNINTNSSNLEFGRATDKQPFIGTLYDVLYLSRVRTSVEISNYYDVIKYTGSYPALETVIFSTSREGSYNIFQMNEDGSSQTNLYPTGLTLQYPLYSTDGNTIYVLDNNTRISKMDSDGGNYQSGLCTGVLSDSIFGITPDNLKAVFTTNNNYGIEVRDFSNALIAFFDSSVIGISSVEVRGGASWHPTNPRVFICSGKINSSRYVINRITLTADYGSTVASIFEVVSISTSSSGNDNFSFTDYRYSKDGSKIGFSRRPNTSGAYNVCIINADGSGFKQLTANTGTTRFASFSPDGSKILFSSNVSGNYQMYTMDIDGTNVINVSNNSYTEYSGDWKV